MKEYLSKEEELELGKLVQAGQAAEKKANEEGSNEVLEEAIAEGKYAVEVLVENHIDLVYNIARKFKNKFPGAPELDDLVQFGMEGLMIAIKRYDPIRKNKLSTMATYWIYQNIARGTNQTARAVKIPENRIVEYSKIVTLKQHYEEEGLNHSEIDKIIMDDLQIGNEYYNSTINAAYSPVSLNKTFDSGSGEPTEIIDWIAESHATPSSEHLALINNLSDTLTAGISNLDEVERDVIASSFGFKERTGKKKTIRSVKEQYNLTSTKYKTIMDEAMSKIKTHLENNGLTYQDFMN